MKKSKFIFTFIVAIAIISFYYVYADSLPKWFPFNTKNALEEWQEKVFKNRVMYMVELKQKEGYLLAKSEQACSGLLYRINFSPKKFPIISWSWQVIKFPEKKASGTEKGGWIERDDYAGRVYVIFPHWNFMQIKSIEYIWDEELPEGTVMTSPYYRNIKLIVVESGRNKMGTWVFEKRNIFEDYKKAFGREPSSNVGAIALMTDTDNTLSTAEALYKELYVGGKDEYKK